MSGAGPSLEKVVRNVGRGLDKRVRGIADDPGRAAAALVTAGGSEATAAIAEEIARKAQDALPSKPPAPPAPPAPAPLPVMPTMDSEEIKRVRRRYTAQQRVRGGRESTRLTSDKLGAN